jgi:hypothetical protein
MKPSKKEKPEQRLLESLIEQFLNEQMEFESLTAAEVAALHLHLIESSIPLQHLGFLRFLKSRGVSRPLAWEHLTEDSIAEYHEFLVQNFGELTRRAAMESLMLIWDWAGQNSYIRPAREPRVFQRNSVAPSFRISVKITDSPEPHRRRS